MGLFFLWFYVQEHPKAQPVVGLWFYVQEHSKAQPAVVLVLKLLRRWGNGSKSHPTGREKPGIEPAIPGLQDIGVSPTPRPRRNSHFETDQVK